jgi:hypothetical protein
MTIATETFASELRLLADLRPHPSNYRRHPEHQVVVLRESLRTHGQQKPVVITPDGTILAGHGLVEAARLEGWTEIACHVYDGPYPEAFLAMDNRASDLAVDDEAAQAALLKQLDEAGQLMAAGWDHEAMAELLARAGRKAAPEETWEPPTELPTGPTRVQPGEVWQLGRHILHCQGSAQLPGWSGRGGLMLYDPPWELPAEEALACIPETLANTVILWGQGGQLSRAVQLLSEHGWRWSHAYAWETALANGLPNLTMPIPMHKAIEVLRRGKGTQWRDDPQALVDLGMAEHRRVQSIIRVTYSPIAGKPHCKPEALFRGLMRIYAERGDTVLDPYAGWGTAIIAAEHTGRVAECWELDPRRCDAILARFEQTIGGRVERVGG